MANERQVLAEAIRAELLELYNDTWRQGDEPALSADELTTRLEWQLLDVRASGFVPIEFSYGAGELFGYHGVTVSVDEAAGIPRRWICSGQPVRRTVNFDPQPLAAQSVVCSSSRPLLIKSRQYLG